MLENSFMYVDEWLKSTQPINKNLVVKQMATAQLTRY